VTSLPVLLSTITTPFIVVPADIDVEDRLIRALTSSRSFAPSAWAVIGLPMTSPVHNSAAKPICLQRTSAGYAGWFAHSTDAVAPAYAGHVTTLARMLVDDERPGLAVCAARERVGRPSLGSHLPGVRMLRVHDSRRDFNGEDHASLLLTG
jgi:hypothetical protein